MTAGVEGVVTEVLREHRPSSLRSWPMKCRCGAEYEDFQAHVAAAVVQALGLTEEWSRLNVNGYCFGRYDSEAQAQANIDREAALYRDSKDSRPAHRWVSPWVAVERGEQ